MTSNPNFTDYVERIQQNLAVFSLTDEEAKRYLMESKPLAEYSPRSIAFEILFNDKIKQEDGTETLERKFDPHVSDKLFEELPPSSHLENLMRLYEWLRRYEYEKLSDIDPVDLAIPEYVERDEYLSKMTKDNLKELSNKISELDEIYERLKDSTNISESDLEKVGKNLYCLLQRYEVQYIPTNIGSTALVYEAWKQGKLIPLGNPEEDSDKFDKLISGLFINTIGKNYQQLLKEMAENLGIHESVRHINQDTLSNGKTWKGSPEGWKWYVCIESALIHKLDKPESGGYLVYYPLLIDDYWFAGVALTYSESDVDPYDSATPELFNYKKYSKIYNTIKSVSDTLKISLREEALKQAEKKIIGGMSKEDVFANVVKDYFVCFNVRKVGETNSSNTNSYKVYSSDDIEIFGSEWLSSVIPEKQELIRREIEGYEAGVGYVRGLRDEVYDLAQRLNEAREEAIEEGIEEQSQKFSHQVVALMNMVWLDPERKKLSSRSRAALWHLKTVTEVLGKNLLDAERPISEIDFHEWKDSIPGEIIQEVADLSLSHALERATLQRFAATDKEKRFIKRINDSAFEILKRDDKIDEFKRRIGLSPLVDEAWSDWAIHKGFILSFYHVFWQAAYHAFRAVCGEQQPLQDTQNAYLKVFVAEEEVEIRNVSVSPDPGVNPKSRDTAFFEDINEVLQGHFDIEGPTHGDNYWFTKISRRVM